MYSIPTYIEHPSEHVLDVAAYGVQTRHLFPVGKPEVDTKLVFPHPGDLKVHVFEGLPKSSSRTRDSDLSVLHLEGY